MKEILVLWSLRGRTLVEVPDEVDVDDYGSLYEAAYIAIENMTTNDFQEDTDGYEIDDLRVQEE